MGCFLDVLSGWFVKSWSGDLVMSRSLAAHRHTSNRHAPRVGEFEAKAT